jgi:hypothetical protein
VQAGSVIEFVLDFVDLRDHRITARHGHRPPARRHCHTAGKPTADETGREPRHLMQELLDSGPHPGQAPIARDIELALVTE